MHHISQLLIFILGCAAVLGWGGDDKVKLKHINTLTLYRGRMTTGRRNSPVPQLKCIGGTAGCKAFTPQVVQCYNRGTDGSDVQWECKTDMDNAYRFGTVEVVCEGYDYPDDPYVLKGSCGLEYTLDLTKEGHQKQQYGHHDYYGDNSHYNHKSSYSTPGKRSTLGDIIILAIIGIIIYSIYRTCLHNQVGGSTDDDSSGPGSYPNRRSWFGFGGGGGYGGGAPPPGFRPDYMPDDSCSGHRSSSGSGAGFWTGAATGGILGYILGNRGNQYHTGYTARPSYPSYDPFGGTSGGSSGDSSSSGTRTASGFGGTRRR